MIDVIEERPKKKCECPSCFSKLAYGKEDIINTFRDNIGHIICPVCGEIIYIAKKNFYF